MRDIKKQNYIVVGAFGLVLTGLILAFIYSVYQMQMKNSESGKISFADQQKIWTENEKKYIETVQNKQEELLARMYGSDRAALNEYKEWSKTIVLYYQNVNEVDKDLTYWFFRSDEAPVKSVLVIDNVDTFKTIDLGNAALDSLGTTTRKTLLLRKYLNVVEDYNNPCKRAGIYEVDAIGNMTLRVTEKLCGVWDVSNFTIHLDEGKDVSVEFVDRADMLLPDDALIHETSSGTLMKLPSKYRATIGEGALLTFLSSGDRSSLSFPVRDVFRGDTTTTLYLLPKPHLDEKTIAVESCVGSWDFMMADMKDGGKEALSGIEKCMEVLNYPFKKLLIPGSSSYYGFMGNGPSIGEGYGWDLGGVVRNSIWCQIDGLPNGCMLYKVERGVPKLLIDPDRERDAEGPSLTQGELLRANEDGSLLIHQFPYEICMFSMYENYDFVKGTSTSLVVDYEDGGCAEGPNTLTFAPKGKTIKFTVLGGYIDGDESVTTTLMFGESNVGSFVASSASWLNGREAFPKEADLAAYALQSDKTKFYFTVGEQNYTLDLAPAIPKLLKR